MKLKIIARLGDRKVWKDNKSEVFSSVHPNTEVAYNESQESYYLEYVPVSISACPEENRCFIHIYTSTSLIPVLETENRETIEMYIKYIIF